MVWRPSLSGKRVAAKLGFPTRNRRKRPETLVAVAEYQDVRDASGGTNPARRFWTRLPVVLRPVHAQVLQPPLKLVEFQPHGRRPLNRYHPNMQPAESGIARRDGVVSPNLPWNQYDRASTGIAWSEVEARP